MKIKIYVVYRMYGKDVVLVTADYEEAKAWDQINNGAGLNPYCYKEFEVEVKNEHRSDV